MEKIIKLSADLYRNVNAIMIRSKYDKREGGYMVIAEPIHVDDTGLYGKCYCLEYYEHDGDGIAKRIPAGRRSAKKEADIDAYIAENAADIALKYTQDIKRKLEITADIDIVKEA